MASPLSPTKQTDRMDGCTSHVLVLVLIMESSIGMGLGMSPAGRAGPPADGFGEMSCPTT